MHNRLKEAEEQITILEDRLMECNQAEKVGAKIIQNENRLRKLRDIIKHNKLCIIGIPEGEERPKGNR